MTKITVPNFESANKKVQDYFNFLKSSNEYTVDSVSLNTIPTELEEFIVLYAPAEKNNQDAFLTHIQSIVDYVETETFNQAYEKAVSDTSVINKKFLIAVYFVALFATVGVFDLISRLTSWF